MRLLEARIFPKTRGRQMQQIVELRRRLADQLSEGGALQLHQWDDAPKTSHPALTAHSVPVPLAWLARSRAIRSRNRTPSVNCSQYRSATRRCGRPWLSIATISPSQVARLLTSRTAWTRERQRERLTRILWTRYLAMTCLMTLIGDLQPGYARAGRWAPRRSPSNCS